MSLQNFWYVTLVKLELVASGSLAHAVAAEAARAEKSVPWSPFQAKVVNQTPDPLKALVPFIGQMLFAQRGGRQIPSTAEALRPLINAKAYRLARLAPNNFRAYLDMAKVRPPPLSRDGFADYPKGLGHSQPRPVGWLLPHSQLVVSVLPRSSRGSGPCARAGVDAVHVSSHISTFFVGSQSDTSDSSGKSRGVESRGALVASGSQWRCT